MFDSFKNKMASFGMRKMIESKMKDVPKEEQEKILNMIEKNPDFFTKIGEEVKKRTDAGEDQMSATMAVMQEHQAELKNLLGK